MLALFLQILRTVTAYVRFRFGCIPAEGDPCLACLPVCIFTRDFGTGEN